MRWLDSITDSMDMILSKLWEIAEDRGGWCAAIQGCCKEEDTATLGVYAPENWGIRKAKTGCDPKGETDKGPPWQSNS